MSEKTRGCVGISWLNDIGSGFMFKSVKKIMLCFSSCIIKEYNIYTSRIKWSSLFISRRARAHTHKHTEREREREREIERKREELP